MAVAVMVGSLIVGQGAPALGAPATPGSATTSPTPAPTSNAVPHAGVAPGTVRPMSTPQSMPAGYSVGGPDVSSHNDPIDWPTVAAGGSKFAYVKASEGDYYTNPYYASDAAAAKANGLVVGPYVWPRPDYPDPITQANYFLQAANYTPGAQSLPPMIDLEWGTAVGSGSCYNLSPADLVSWIHQFVGRLQQATGRDPVIYTNTNWWNPCTGNDTSFGSLPLDIASWNSSPGPLPAGWNDYAFWQYTDNAAIGGAGVVDGNVFNGTPDGLVAFATVGNRPPLGSLDAVGTTSTGAITLRGWALDPDTSASIQADVYVDGVGAARLTADQSRPDVGAVYPGQGDLHGFSATLAAGPGSHEVCVYGLDSAGGTNALAGCQNTNHPPFGSLDGVSTTPTSITVRGWAMDPDTTSSIYTDVYVDGVGAARVTADQYRPDVGAAYPGQGDMHGFTGTVGAGQGTHQVCTYAIDSAGGTNTFLGCQTVVVNHPPFGSLDSVSATSTSITVQGWSIDPDTTSSIYTDVYVDGVGVARVTADQYRPDVGAAYPGEGDTHGFSATVGDGPGTHQVCTYAIDTTNGPNTLLGCRTVTS